MDNPRQGSDLTSIDPEAGAITALFPPGKETWSEHFRLGWWANAALAFVGDTLYLEGVTEIKVVRERYSAMQSRPHTTASKKRRMARKAKRRAGNKPQLGIPPKGKGWVGKKAVAR